MSSKDELEFRIPDNWRINTMENSLESIIDYRGKTPAKSKTGIVTLSAKSVKNGYIDYTQAYYISSETYDEFMVRGFPKQGDILLTTEAPMGLVAKLDREGVGLAQRLLTLRGKKEVLDNNYLMYYLMSEIGQHQLKARETGTTVTGIKQSEFRKALVVLPPIKEQIKIGHILSTLDEKIEVNNLINKNLEDMAQAIFKRWFVDFEFPNEEGEPYKSSGGEMIESELGMIPKGWKTGVLTDQADILSGGTPKTSIKEYWDGEIPFFTPKDCTDIYTFETEKYLSRTGLNNCNSRLFEKGTTLITARGTVGKVSMAGREMAMNQSCYAIKAKSIEFDLLTYFFVVNGIETLQKNATGSVFNSIIVSTFNTIKITIPECKLLLKFNQILVPMFELIHTLLLETNQLKKSRDNLLPKLMSGEIRVPVEES